MGRRAPREAQPAARGPERSRRRVAGRNSGKIEDRRQSGNRNCGRTTESPFTGRLWDRGLLQVWNDTICPGCVLCRAAAESVP